MNLTKTAEFVKKFFKWLVLIVGSYYLVTLVLYPGSRAIIKAIFVKSVPASPIYGQLDQLKFVQKNLRNSDPEIDLDTPNGRLPNDLPDRMKVYKFKPQQYSYLAGTNAIEEARKLGFTEVDLTSDLKGTVYKWRNSITSSVLSIDINNRKLQLNTNLTGKSSYFTRDSINTNSAKKIASQIMSSIYRYGDLYKKGTQKVALGTYSGSRIKGTTVEEEAQFARVDFYRSIEDYPILGQDPEKGLLRMVVRRQSRSPDPMNNPIIEADYWEIETTSKSSYPIIPVNSAWSAVSAGRGVITSVVPKTLDPFENYSPVQVDKIFIDEVYLAYYETPEYQTYLQPIYVFSGTYTARGSQGGDIVIYYPAVTGEFVKTETPETTE